jgi:hypothetical protein
VDEYVDEFEDLVDLAGYTDDIAIVVKFRRGLNPAIQDKIAESGRDRPDDDDQSAWYKAARRFDLNRLANEAFHASSTRRSAPAPPSTTRGFLPRMSFATPAAPTAAVQPSRPPPRTPYQGVPMDIDANRSKQAPTTCYRCGKPGHLSRECPMRFDIRHMSAEERDELLESMLAAKDAVVEPTTGSEEIANEVPVREEDFGHHDG